MAKQIIYDSDSEDNSIEFQLEAFHSNDGTLRIYIESKVDIQNSAWIDFNKESALALVKDLKNLIKDM